jgi:hypothetical protein
MATLIVHPANQEESDAVKAVMKLLNIAFEEEKDEYDPEFVAKIQKSRKQIKNGETRAVNINDL